jgi:hypothetical protein
MAWQGLQAQSFRPSKGWFAALIAIESARRDLRVGWGYD